MPRSSTRLIRRALAALAFAAICCVPLALEAQATGRGETNRGVADPVGREGLLAFTNWERGPRGIATLDLETGKRRVYEDLGPVVDGDFSPDGQRITFSQGRTVAVMNANGTGLRTVVDRTHYTPAFSASGRRILFSTNGGSGSIEIHSVKLDGSDLRLEVRIYESGVAPSPSQDGRLIAYQASRGIGNGFPGPHDIEVFDTETGETAELTDDAMSYFPRFSPDGSQLVFSRDFQGNRDVYVMNADGSDAERLTDDPAADDTPIWSPDGSKVAFTSDRSGTADVLTLDLADGEVEPLLADPDRVEVGLDWSVPDDVAPRTLLRGAPRGAVKPGPQSVRLIAREAVTPLGQIRYRCRIDSRRSTDCDARLQIPRLGPGPHRIEAVAIDGAGNRDQTPAVAHWRVRR